MNVLIVENSPYLFERIANQVNSIPFARVSGHAATVWEAIDALNRQAHDMVLLDIRLDEGTGMQVLQAVQARRNPPVVIVLTNYPYPQYRKKYLDAGADYFFDKSTEMEEALRIVRQTAEKRFLSTPAPAPMASYARHE